MKQEKAEILWNNQVSPSCYTIGLSCDIAYKEAVPGQFIMLSLYNQGSPFLRRPFSIHGLVADTEGLIRLEILYKVVGEFTALLAGQKPGESADLMGPLGKGFSIQNGLKDICIVAGGVGIAPLIFLLSRLRENTSDFSRIQVFLGGATGTDLLCLDELEKFNMKVHPFTEDGSTGQKGLVTDTLEAVIERKKPDIIYACGPSGMLKTVANLAEKHTVFCQVSIETMMGCGFGVCLGCAIEKRKTQGEGYWHACMDGPVFDSTMLRFC